MLFLVVFGRKYADGLNMIQVRHLLKMPRGEFESPTSRFLSALKSSVLRERRIVLEMSQTIFRLQQPLHSSDSHL